MTATTVTLMQPAHKLDHHKLQWSRIQVPSLAYGACATSTGAVSKKLTFSPSSVSCCVLPIWRRLRLRAQFSFEFREPMRLEIRTLLLLWHMLAQVPRNSTCLENLGVIPKNFPKVGAALQVSANEGHLAPCGCPTRTLPP